MAGGDGLCGEEEGGFRVEPGMTKGGGAQEGEGQGFDCAQPERIRDGEGGFRVEPGMTEGGGDAALRIQPNKHRPVQMALTGGRKLFDAARRRVFLEWFAATCNVKFAADQAGINYKTAFRHRMQDAAFAAAWDVALEQGFARLRAKMLETPMDAAVPGIEGDWDAPEMPAPDRDTALAMLREAGRRKAGYPKAGRPPQVANAAEVEAALVKRLAAFGVRVTGKAASDDEGKKVDSGSGPE